MLNDSGAELRKKLGVVLLDEHSMKSLDEHWENVRKEGRLYVHAEVKLAMFYLGNTNKHPLHGVIGVSEKLCLACDIFFRYVESIRHDAGELTDYHRALRNPNCINAGPPQRFVFAGAHRIPDNSWQIPRLPDAPIHGDGHEKRII